MSGKWVGFTEDDLKNLNIGEKNSIVAQKPVRVAKLQPVPRQQSKKNVARGRILHHQEVKPQIGNEGKPLMSTNMEKPSSEFLSQEIGSSHLSVNAGKDDSGNESLLQLADNPITSASDESPSHMSVCLRIKEGRSYEVMGSEKISLDEFQARQKLMEEQNRCRKELLAKAIADRRKKTHAESQRLQQIQEELQKLDMLLSNDVSILRNQIEVASLEFNEAQKRYNKLEKEFLDAKLKMFGKLEQKELLTEHLCTIIEQNEMRKARKLSELMDKLELGVIVGLPALDENQVSGKEIPSANDSLNDISESADNSLGDNPTKIVAVSPTEQVEGANGPMEVGDKPPINGSEN